MTDLITLGIVFLYGLGCFGIFSFIMLKFYPYLPDDQIQTFERVEKRINILHPFYRFFNI